MGAEAGRPAGLREGRRANAAMLQRWIGSGRSNARLEVWERRTEPFLLFLAAVMLLLLLLPWLADLSTSAARISNAVEWAIWAVFAIDLAVRVWLAEERLRYLIRNWLDVLIVALPFLRPLRLLRLLWFVARFGKLLNRRGVRGTALLAAALLAGATVAVWFLERDTNSVVNDWPSAVWWTVHTIATGDGVREAQTIPGRALGVVVTLLGFALLGMITATIAAWFVESGQDVEQEEILAHLRRLEAEVQALRHEVNSEGGAAGRSERSAAAE